MVLTEVELLSVNTILCQMQGILKAGIHPYLSILVYTLSYNRCPNTCGNTCERIEEKLQNSW